MVPFTPETTKAIYAYLRQGEWHVQSAFTNRLWSGQKGALTSDGVRSSSIESRALWTSTCRLTSSAGRSPARDRPVASSTRNPGSPNSASITQYRRSRRGFLTVAAFRQAVRMAGPCPAW